MENNIFVSTKRQRTQTVLVENAPEGVQAVVRD